MPHQLVYLLVRGAVGRVSKSIDIPAGEGRAFTVSKGQVFRLVQVEEKQVADAVFVNQANIRERFHPGFTVWLNCIKGLGNMRRVKELYSAPPFENVMATIEEDKVGQNFAYMGTRCSRLIYKLRDSVDAPPHRTCQDNLALALAPYRIRPDDIPDVFNIWMNVEISKNGCFVIKSPTVRKGDFVRFRAEMDLIVAISACPNDTQPVNDYKVKPLRVEMI